MRSASGFSLIELMVVVMIVAILTAVALPAYQDYLLRGRLTEAYNTLAAQRVKMEQFYQDNQTYVGTCVNGTVAPQPTGTYFTYACSNQTQNTYLITATGIASAGVPAAFTFTIDQSNTKTTAGVGTGWTAPTGQCWVRTKSGQC
ncbi:MAG TPA: type IV pilin protein [Burkholderiales bacterium]|nr:type IV pilin protein [Burkholderiales bacterium]